MKLALALAGGGERWPGEAEGVAGARTWALAGGHGARLRVVMAPAGDWEWLANGPGVLSLGPG